MVSADQAFLQFFGDEFLRLLLIRFVFCSAALRLHKLFRVSPKKTGLLLNRSDPFFMQTLLALAQLQRRAGIKAPAGSGPAGPGQANVSPAVELAASGGSKVLVLCVQECRSFPESYPELPKQDTVESSLLQKHILDLAAMLDVQNLFWDNSLETY